MAIVEFVFLSNNKIESWATSSIQNMAHKPVAARKFFVSDMRQVKKW
jgi:hypothetical protein